MGANNQNRKTNSNNSSFVRWQGRSLEELGKAINLLLSLTLATSGFIISKILDSGIRCGLNILHTVFITLGLGVSLITTIVLLYLIHNRLLSFRKTTKIARKREKGEMKDIKALRDEIKRKDRLTWKLWDFSIVLFFVSQFFTILGFTLYFIYS